MFVFIYIYIYYIYAYIFLLLTVRLNWNQDFRQRLKTRSKLTVKMIINTYSCARMYGLVI